MKIILILFLFTLSNSSLFGQIQLLDNGNIGLGTLMPKEQVQIGNWLTFHDGGSKVIGCNFHFDNNQNLRLNDGFSQALYMGGNGLSIRTASFGLTNSIINWKSMLNIYENSVVIDSDYVSGPFKFYLNGNQRATGIVLSEGFFVSSDSLLKSEIKTISKPLSLLNQIEGKTYKVKSTVLNPNQILSFGLIAQEVKAILPELVSTIDDKSDILAVNYDGFVPILIESIKEQNKQIQELNASILALKKEVERLKITEEASSVVEIFIPLHIKSARMEQYDSKGEFLSLFEIKDRGLVKLPIKKFKIERGAIYYILIGDNDKLKSGKITDHN